MRVLLLTAGSRGDVEPFLALARRIGRAGHEVRLGVTAEFVDVVRRAGVEVAPLEGNLADLVAQQGVSPLRALRTYRSVIRPMMARMLQSAARAAVAYHPDVVVHHPKVLSAAAAAERLGVPRVLVEIVPTITPTREFPAAGLTARDLGPLNRLTYGLAAVAGRPFAGALRDVRVDLGLPERGHSTPPALTLVPVSPTLVPRPADWPDAAHLTGAWSEPPAGVDTADEELAAFLADGRVLYAGLGSMAAGDPAARARTIVAATRAAGLRALLVTGWGGLAAPPDLRGDDLLVRAAVTHATVLPRCAAALHHAGAGTTHAAVRAGVVSVPVPVLVDQPFWAAVLHRRGLAPAPVPLRRLSVERLGAALDAVPHHREATAVAARSMAAEDGTGRALRLLGTLV